MGKDIKFLFDHIPAPGEDFEVVAGIKWIRMPLPFKLDHINVWMIEEEDSWVLIDSGLNDEKTKALWNGVLERLLNGKVLERLICTHAHPDHIGLVGWFNEQYGTRLITTREEWSYGRLFCTGAIMNKQLYHDFYKRAGCQESDLECYYSHITTADQLFYNVPQQFDRIRNGSVITIGESSWEVITGLGHSHELACLYNAELDVLIAGDQVLPKITPTIMVHAYEPEANPLLDFFESNEKLRSLPASATVLPSHGLPFKGLHERLDEYRDHHKNRLDIVLSACNRPLTAIEVSKILFPQDLDSHGKFFAMGETLAHIRYLESEGNLIRYKGGGGADLYSET